MKKTKEQIEEEKQEKKETIKAHKALDDLIKRALERGAFISESKILNNDRNIRENKNTEN